MTLEVIPVAGLPEIGEGEDLAALIASAAELRHGDVVAVTQKVVSKAEGRLVPEGEDWVARETKEYATRWGKDPRQIEVVLRESRRVVRMDRGVVISETRHGFVCANAGVDRSNVPHGFLSLLPEDPDATAARLAQGLAEHAGRRVAVVVTDTFGRPWRHGVVNVAIGVAGLPAVVDLRGDKDAHGRVLEATVIALADEVAAAAGLVQGKADGVPIAVVRGLTPDAPPGSGRDLVRPREDDLFRESPLQSIFARRTIRSFAEGGVPREVLREAAAASLTAPVPHGDRRPTRPWLWVILDSEPAKRRLLGAMAEAWVRDLRADGLPEDRIRGRLDRSDALLGAAPILALPALTMANADHYPDERRREAEREMFLLATGAMVQSFLLALHAQGYGGAWVSSALFCKDEARDALGLAPEWLPMGSVACGPVSGDPPPRPPIDPGSHLRFG